MRTALAVILTLWIGTSVDAYDQELWTHYTSQNVVTSIAEGESEIYFGTSGGVRRYHRFRQAWLRPITTADGLPDNFVRQMGYDRNTGDLIIETRTGSARWMSNMEALTPGVFTELNPYNRIPTIPHSIVPPFGYYINGDIIRGPRRTYRILDAHVDSWNVLWLATNGLGIGKADLTFNQLEFLQSGPEVSNVTALEFDGDDLWVGARDDITAYARGISRYDRRNETWTYYMSDEIPRLDDTQVADILADSTNVWFATEQGIVRYRKEEDAWDTYLYRRSQSARHVRNTMSLARGAGRLWLGTLEGLAVLDLGADTLRAVGGSRDFRINDLASGTNHIWAATHRGLFRCTIDSVTWTPVRDVSAATRPVLAVTTSGDSTWALASSPPVLLVSAHPDSAWRSIELPEAAGSDRAAMSVSGKRLWIGTKNGIVRVNTRSGNTDSMNAIDGLLDDWVHDLRLDGQDVWIATRGGLSLYRWGDDFRDPED